MVSDFFDPIASIFLLIVSSYFGRLLARPLSCKPTWYVTKPRLPRTRRTVRTTEGTRGRPRFSRNLAIGTRANERRIARATGLRTSAAKNMNAMMAKRRKVRMTG